MICQECHERPATLHFTKINNGEKTVFHLCEKCAQEKGETFMANGGSGFSLSNLLSGLLNMDHSFQPAQKSPFYQKEILQCKECTMTYQEFTQIGKFGCANCYETFKEQIKPILRKVHFGNLSHNGKIPKRIGGTIHIRKNIEDLKQKMKEYISLEEFEQAAEVRDRIRSLEKQMNDQRSEGGI